MCAPDSFRSARCLLRGCPDDGHANDQMKFPDLRGVGHRLRFRVGRRCRTSRGSSPCSSRPLSAIPALTSSFTHLVLPFLAAWWSRLLALA